ncbi:hypothetical protein A5756_04030 [Mycobacterium sp. 852002-53434_SCH5985345]|uniref:DUF2561 family protein n=1 Tax=unclassified Mycobacterium TaxID=2642494 RepID=UPI0007FC9CEF|nr:MULTISPECIES: DUF2561 family protein [unclassified Mycobacterium]OBF59919.1 hypothetical protein A5756_04030 [Mycobacterium sp. 852002-53434_SCH5985345]OBF77373.1 hypothetical protein A5750_06395 [Mycobacterium sp. 852002-51613_SCH5001154]OBF94405.1 hypothetical protein A5773_15980 [Mycobacterium sp. 852014-52450_SCH5900713]
MVGRYSAYRRGVGDDTISPDVIDRILIGACAAVWLVLLGVSVAAAVALADLGRGFHKAANGTHSTSWVLYAVIIVSALIIAGAIPMLLRARRMAQTEPAARGMTSPNRPPVRLMSQAPRTAADRARQPRVQAPVQTADSGWSGEAVDRVWLRGTVLLLTAIGAALVAVATATYLMAVGHDGPAWVAYVVAGVVTAGMPVIEWLHVRLLRRAVAEQ